MKRIAIHCLRFVALPLILPLFLTATAAAATVSCSSNTSSLFGFPTWYSYLQVQENPVTHSCDIVNFNVPGGFLLIALALLDIALRLAGLVAIGFVIYGGFQYVTSQGEPDKTAKAQHTILDALIGLAITFVAVGVVAFLGSKLG